MIRRRFVVKMTDSVNSARHVPEHACDDFRGALAQALPVAPCENNALNCAPDTIRTCGLPIRNRLLYPAELRERGGAGIPGRWVSSTAPALASPLPRR